MLRYRYAYQRKYNHEHNPANGEFGSAGGSGEPTLETLGVGATQTWKDKFAENTKIRYEMYGEAHNMTPEQYKSAATKQAQTLVEGTRLFVRVKPAGLQKILDQGRFKTQFETNRSGGTVNKSTRNDFESEAFGFNEEKQPVEMRPIYGYLSKDMRGDNTKADVSQYGNIAVQLYEKVKDRTTTTFGDSLTMTAGGHYQSVIPQPVNHPTSDMFPLYNGIDPLAPKEFENLQYIEAQIHGGVTVKDIQSVTFHGKRPTAALRKALGEAFIPYQVKP